MSFKRSRDIGFDEDKGQFKYQKISIDSKNGDQHPESSKNTADGLLCAYNNDDSTVSISDLSYNYYFYDWYFPSAVVKGKAGKSKLLTVAELKIQEKLRKNMRFQQLRYFQSSKDSSSSSSSDSSLPNSPISF